MHVRVPFLFLLLLLWVCPAVYAQTIQGEVLSLDGKKPLDGVNINNVHTGATDITGTDGKFMIAATKGQLLEFRRPGYKTTRVRVPDGYIPPYFKILIQQGGDMEVPQAIVAHSNRYDYTSDSIRFHELYKHELDFAKMSTFDMIQHPFSALSRHNREIWQFQDDYKKTEREKYVDKTFNPELIESITGLKGDSVNMYIRRFRPTYEQLHNMNDYTFYNYIKRTVQQFRSRNNGRNSGR